MPYAGSNNDADRYVLKFIFESIKPNETIRPIHFHKLNFKRLKSSFANCKPKCIFWINLTGQGTNNDASYLFL